MSNKCIYCNKVLVGRSDKKYCNDQCRALAHHKTRKTDDKAVYFINQILKTNRNILKRINPSGKTTIRKSYLLAHGFDFRFFTHIYKTKNNTYFFCYEYGYMPLVAEKKVVIINWQEYMRKNLPDSFSLF